MKEEIKFSKNEWIHIGKQAGWVEAQALEDDQGDVAFTDEEFFALKSLSYDYRVAGKDQISIFPNVTVQKNGENSFSVYNKATQEYETANNFNSVIELVKKWNEKKKTV